MASLAPSSCENPSYPNWMWRYNRNKHLTKFEPWFTRVERWPPHYRNMGVKDNFQFHPPKSTEGNREMWGSGLNYAHHLNKERQTGFGNSALGLVPGPAPPRFVRPEVVPHQIGELLKINCIENVAEGASLHDHSSVPTQSSRHFEEPLNPREYLQKTLGQPMEYPGTFPHINGTAPKTDVGSIVCCGGTAKGARRDPLQYWLDYYKHREETNSKHDSVLPYTYPEQCCEYEWDPDKIKCID